jgi:hypothetical protein
VEVDVEDGSRITGVLHTATLYQGAQKKELVLKGCKIYSKAGELSRDYQVGCTLVLDFSKVVCLAGKVSDAPSRAKLGDFETDSNIKKHGDMSFLQGRELQSVSNTWLEPGTETSLESNSGHWDQFEVNQRLFNVRSSFDENLYTKKLDVNAITPEQRARAERLAREIESQTSGNVHLQEERGQQMQQDYDEEALYSGVIREEKRTNNNVQNKPVDNVWRRGGKNLFDGNPAPTTTTSTSTTNSSAAPTNNKSQTTNNKANNKVSPPPGNLTPQLSPAQQKELQKPSTTSTSATASASASPVPEAAASATPPPTTSTSTPTAASTSTPPPAAPTEDKKEDDKAASFKFNPNVTAFVPRATAPEFKPSFSAPASAPATTTSTSAPAVSAAPPSIPAPAAAPPSVAVPPSTPTVPAATPSVLPPSIPASPMVLASPLQASPKPEPLLAPSTPLLSQPLPNSPMVPMTAHMSPGMIVDPMHPMAVLQPMQPNLYMAQPVPNMPMQPNMVMPQYYPNVTMPPMGPGAVPQMPPGQYDQFYAQQWYANAYAYPPQPAYPVPVDQSYMYYQYPQAFPQGYVQQQGYPPRQGNKHGHMNK